MWISLSALVFSSVLAFVIRILLQRENKRLDKEGEEDFSAAGRERIEEAARLEGISFKQALDRKRRFRYPY